MGSEQKMRVEECIQHTTKYMHKIFLVNNNIDRSQSKNF